jgi:hypothetical protein
LGRLEKIDGVNKRIIDINTRMNVAVNTTPNTDDQKKISGEMLQLSKNMDILLNPITKEKKDIDIELENMTKERRKDIFTNLKKEFNPAA